MVVYLTYMAMFVCAAALVALIRRYDLYEKEPWYMVMLAVFMGAGVMWLVGLTEDFVLRQMQLRPDALAAKAAVVAVAEETAKLLVVLSIALLFRRHFNDPLDGVIYGTLCGLGTAVEESLLYISLAQPTVLAFGAEVVRLLAHSLMGGVVGFAVGFAVALPPRRGAGVAARRGVDGTRPPTRRPKLAAVCVLVAMLVHFAWNYLAYQSHHPPVLRGVLMLLMLTLMMLWGAMAALAAEKSRLLFVPDYRRYDGRVASSST